MFEENDQGRPQEACARFCRNIRQHRVRPLCLYADNKQRNGACAAREPWRFELGFLCSERDVSVSCRLPGERRVKLLDSGVSHAEAKPACWMFCFANDAARHTFNQSRLDKITRRGSRRSETVRLQSMANFIKKAIRAGINRRRRPLDRARAGDALHLSSNA